MKNFKIVAFLAVATMAMVGCDKYDDSAVNERIDKVESRLLELEKKVDQMNSNLSVMQTTLTAFSNEDHITEITTLAGGIGYTITFSKFGTVTLYNGNTPTVSAKQDSDGVYYWYWTLSGEWLLDKSGNKIPTSIIPQFRVNSEGALEISYDGVNYYAVSVSNASGEAFSPAVFASVVDGEDSVTFTLANGQEIVIPKGQNFALKFEESSFALVANVAQNIPFTVTGADEATVVDGFGTNGYEMGISTGSVVNGIMVGALFVQAPIPVVNGKAIVVATNSKGATSAKILTFEEGSIVVSPGSNASAVSASGGEVSVSITSNIDYEIIIPDEAQSWISYAETKATVTKNFTFTVAENTGEAREAFIIVRDMFGYVVQNFIIAQKEKKGEEEAGTVTFEFAELCAGMTNGTYVSSFEKNDITLTFAAPEGATNPKYYNTETSVRMYKGSSLTVKAHSETIKITEIDFTFGRQGNSLDITPDSGNWDYTKGATSSDLGSGVWTGSANQVVFTQKDATGNNTYKVITVKYTTE